MNTTMATASSKVPKFKFDGFIPRQDLKEKAHMVVDYIREKMPGDANLVAEVKKRFGKYYFKVEVNGTTAQFEANSIIDPLTEDTTDRNWLLKGLDQVFGSMRGQLKDWVKNRNL
jgi:hypothetical protein